MKRLLATLALAVVVACGSTEPVDEFKGAYDLVTVNGQPLPRTQVVSDITLTLDKGLLIISPAGGWSLATSGTRKIGTQPSSPTSEIVNGEWHAEGNAITLLSSVPPTVIEATYANGTITFSRDGFTYVFTR